jgi:LytS/YehU family sensor histidine kinase
MEQLRFGDGFEFEITHPNDFYMHEIKIPPLLIQPLVENAIIHGIRGIGKNGKISVSLKKFDYHLECIVQDNGIGYNHSIFSGIPKSEHKSFGLGLLRSRLNFFNNKNIVENVLIIEDLNETNETLSGTKITINIPLTIQ